MTDLERDVRRLIADSQAECVGVALSDLETNHELFINAEVALHPASTMKVCVMMEVLRQVAVGRYCLDQEVQVRNEFVSLADGSTFAVMEADDSDKDIYAHLGRTMSIRDLIRRMIVRSGNLATNLLIDLVTAEAITRTMTDLGAPDLVVLRGLEDNRAYAMGLNNRATARGLTHILSLLAEGMFVDSEICRAMVEVLLDQEFNQGMPARLPSSVKVAHKTGWIDAHFHDVGLLIEENRRPVALSILTRGIQDKSQAHALVAAIAQKVYASL